MPCYAMLCHAMPVAPTSHEDWQGGTVPQPPSPGAWLLPASDAVAMEISERQEELREAGWQILSCSPELLGRLDDKARHLKRSLKELLALKVKLQELASERSLAESFPQRWLHADDATYPCALALNALHLRPKAS